MSDPVRLVRELAGTEPPPVWPEGIALGPLDPASVHALMRLSYAGRFGGAPEVRWQDWWGNVSTDSEFDPGLCIVAVDTAGAPAGFVLCWTSSFIKDLVVRPDWQRRGLGAALLRETFCRLALRGSRSVALKVDGANHVARALYVKMGFRG